MLSMYPTNATDSELDKQRRLFNKFSNNWLSKAIISDDISSDDTQNKPNPGLRFFEELLKIRRQRYISLLFHLVIYYVIFLKFRMHKLRRLFFIISDHR